MIHAGDVVAHYRVMGKLANGGMASVYLARDLDMSERLVVLKTILPHLRGKADYQSMFEREARVGKMVRHPGAVEVIEVVQWRDTPVLVMEFLEGRNLIQVIGAARRRRQAISYPVLAHIVDQLAHTMQYAWTVPDANGNPAQIIHRDISPENVVLTYEGAVKLVDFGIAKHSHIDGGTLAGQLKGKYSYMSPEQIHGELTDHRSDQYALGVLLYILLTGRKPFVGENDVQLLSMIISDDPVPPSQIDPTVPGALEEVALRALRKSPEARFADHAHFAATVEDRYLVRRPAGSADVRALMSELFPANSDAVRRRIQMLIEAEREATVTGIFIELPEPEPDATRHDETVIEVAMPDAPTANYRATAVQTSSQNASQSGDSDELEEATRLVDMGQKRVTQSPTAARPVAAQIPARPSPQSRLRSRGAALLALGAAAALGAFLARSPVTDEPEMTSISGQVRPGTVAVRVAGADAVAEVRVNGIKMGETPIEVPQEARTVRVLCSFKKRQVVRRMSVDVRPGERSLALCEVGTGDLIILGPPGYSVGIDDNPPVKLPVSLKRTMEGTYHLAWSRRGSVVLAERTVRLKPDSALTIRHWRDLP